MSLVDPNLARKLENYGEEASGMKKQTFIYAWNTDGMKEERERGVTIDYNEKQMYITKDCLNRCVQSTDSVNYNYNNMSDINVTFYDCPGHHDFISNMISGSVNADAAILVIDTIDFKNNYQFGSYKFKPQTLEHIKLVKNLGIFQYIICLNKIDKIEFNNELLDNIENEITSFLTSKDIAIKKDHIHIVRCSA